MADFGDQQFYDVRGPEEAPEQKKKIDISFLRRWLILLSVIILLILAIILVRRFMGDFNDNLTADQLAFENISAQIELMVEDCDETEKDYCRNQYWTDAALADNNLDYCDMLSDDWFNSCVAQIAQKVQDADLCKKITDDQEAVICSDSILFTLARENSDLVNCDLINSESTKASCVAMVVELLAESNSCPDEGTGAVECALQERLIEASQEGDYRSLGRASLEYESCIDILESRDTDDDGLSDLAEIEDYGTDFKNADSDGDGYDDGVEIASGYDPLK